MAAFMGSVRLSAYTKKSQRLSKEGKVPSFGRRTELVLACSQRGS